MDIGTSWNRNNEPVVSNFLYVLNALNVVLNLVNDLFWRLWLRINFLWLVRILFIDLVLRTIHLYGVLKLKWAVFLIEFVVKPPPQYSGTTVPHS